MNGRSLKFLVPTCGTCHHGIEFKGEKKIPKSSAVAIRHKQKRKGFLDVEEREKPARRDAWLTHRKLTTQFDAIFRR